MPWVGWADASAAAFARKFYLELDDAQQVARLAAWKAFDQWQPGTPVSQERFVRTKAFFAIIDLMRQRDQGRYGSFVGRVAYANGERFDPLYADPEILAYYAPAARSHTSAVDARFDVERALAMIPAREAAVVEMIDLEGFTQTQVAEALGLSESRISQLRTKAFSRMRPLLAA